MLLVDMTPQQIRDVFENHADDVARVEHAIKVALGKLEWIEKRSDKAKSPYALSKLTAGLPNQDEILRQTMRINEAKRSEAAMGVTVHANDPRVITYIMERIEREKAWFWNLVLPRGLIGRMRGYFLGV